MKYAGFWRQLIATTIDQVVIVFPSVLIPRAYFYFALAGGATQETAKNNSDTLLVLLTIGFYALYYIVLNGRYGITLGRRIMNIKLVRLDQPNRDGIGYGKAAFRLMLFIIGGSFLRVSAIAGMPIILSVTVDTAAAATLAWLLIDTRRRTLEDMLAGTVLVHDPLGKYPDFDPDKLPPAAVRPFSMGTIVLINALASIYIALQT